MHYRKKGWVFAQVPIWAICDPNLSAGALRLLAYLAWRQGNDGSCWPSLGRMQTDLGCGERTVQRHLRELEEAGYLVTTRRPGRSNTYSLVADPSCDPGFDKLNTGEGEGLTASERYTPTPVNSGGGAPSKMAGTPVKPDGGAPSEMAGTRVKPGGGVPSEMAGTPVNSGTHDDKKEQEKKDKEKGDDTFLSLWSSVLKALRLQMTRATFETWLVTATARWDGQTLTVQLKSQAAKAWVSARLDRIVSRTVRRIFGEELAVAYTVQEGG
jgi:hypothetical protein